MANLSVNLCGVQFKNPVIAASGTYGFGREFNELYDVGQIGGVSTKGLTMEPRLGNPVPRIAESRGVILNAVGLQNPGVEHFIENDLGSCTVFFENIESYTGDKTLHVENHLGSMEINVPKEWRVVINIENTLGGASYPDEEENGDNDKKILYINGENNLGSISIEYV